jgi:DNA-binding SARP family transcriptional activator
MSAMGIEARLLGPPLVVRDGVVYAAPRGKKVWALLAYLALSEQAPTRQHLADLLFPDAEDPASALRWNLSELRRLLGGPDTVGSGTTVGLRLPRDTTIDVHVLQAGTSADAVALPGLGRELLEGVRVEASPGFAAWLLGERRRLQSIGSAVLREGALRAIAANNVRAAVELATRLVGTDPLDQDAHVLLVRAFAATGDETAVQDQLTASAELFRVELGEDIAPALYGAARLGVVPSRAPGDTRAAAEAHRESGEAALGAGALDVGLEELRAAVDAASDDPALEASMLLSLGSALVHAAHGRDEDGSAALHRAIAAADATGDRRTSAAAHRELGYVELLRADYARSLVWLQQAEELADGDELELSRVRSVRAATFGDVGKHETADEEADAAVALAESAGAERQLAWVETIRGRGQLCRDDVERAEATLENARDRTRSERWTAFLSFPEALLGEVWLRTGRIDQAAEILEHAFTLGCSVDDACWEAYAVRGMGLLQAARGDLDEGIASMDDALTRCLRQSDTHQWIRGYVMEARCALGVAAGHPLVGTWVAELASFAGHTGMREFAVRAYLYQRDLGDPDALEAARALVVEVQNPHLHELLEAEEMPRLEQLIGVA